MRQVSVALAAALPAALLAGVIAGILVAGNAGCGPSKSAGSCLQYYQENVPGITQAQLDVCLVQTSKQDGMCCVAGSQCTSGVCCGWDQTCGARQSCECVGN